MRTPGNALIIWAADITVAAKTAADATDVVPATAQALDVAVDRVASLTLVGADLANLAQLLKRPRDLTSSATQQAQQPIG